MRLGALLGPVTDAAKTDTLAEQAREFAGEGYSSLWSAQAVGRGFMMTDPLLALTVAATVAESVELGTAVLQTPLYHPMDLAHRVFSLQQICGERLILGVGAGSTDKDFNAFNRSYADRFSTFAENIRSLRDIFANGGPSPTAGADNANLSPWPAVRGGPKMFYGTWGRGVEVAAHSYDGWIASGHYRTVAQVRAAIQRYRRAGGGRAIISTIQVTADTNLGELQEKLQRYAEAGFDDAVVMLLPGAASAATVRKLVG